jgi:hypothetical protein
MNWIFLSLITAHSLRHQGWRLIRQEVAVLMVGIIINELSEAVRKAIGFHLIGMSFRRLHLKSDE